VFKFDELHPQLLQRLLQQGELCSTEEERLARMCVVRSVYSSVLQRKVEDEQRNLGGLEEHFQQVKKNNYVKPHI
jgi:hypothetical protein